MREAAVDLTQISKRGVVGEGLGRMGKVQGIKTRAHVHKLRKGSVSARVGPALESGPPHISGMNL